MKLKKILFLDDGDISQTVERIRTKLQRQGYDIKVDIINPQNIKYKDGKDSSKIIFDKLKKDIEENYRNSKYDIVACDFSFASDELNGYDLIRWVINTAKSKNFKFKKAKFVCYSSEEDKFKEHIINNDELLKLIKLNIHAFYKRDNLTDELSSLVNTISKIFSASEYFKELLEQEADREFQNIYPNFHGKKLMEIANEIDSDSHHGREFQKYMVDLTYAHIIELNK